MTASLQQRTECVSGIETVAVVGMGALGVMFADRIVQHIGPDKLCFLMDGARLARHGDGACRVNGAELRFRVRRPEDVGPVDLLIFATKFGGLAEAMDQIDPAVGEDTVIISLLNGIITEDILAERYGRARVVDCVAIGMDAMREGSEITYQNMGRLQIGARVPEQGRALEQLAVFLARAGVPFELPADIIRAMWNKFMINVGINQTCMVYGVPYAVARGGGEAYASMVAAMREVIPLARAEGVHLTEEDLKSDLQLLAGLNPDGYPSMRQDALAGRRSELELFAGTVLRLARRHGLPAPVNARYCAAILEMERDLPARPAEG